MALVPSDERLRAIIRTQTEITTAGLDLLETMQLIAERSQELTSASAAVIELADGDEMIYEVATGEAAPYVGLRLKQAGSLSGQCVAEGRLLHSVDTSVDPRVDSAACARVGAASMICLPLTHRREVVGVLKVYSGVVGNFDEEKVETLELLTDLVAAHISHATRFEVESNESRHDALTGLGNRRAYQERIAVETARASRYGEPLSVCLFDVDDFRTVNDRLGHSAGDEVLRGVARIFDESRVSDDTFRVGGDEFAILMPRTEREDAQIAAERLAAEIAAAALGTGTLEVSFGVAGAETGDPVVAHATADAELLAAKQRRRDRNY